MLVSPTRGSGALPWPERPDHPVGLQAAAHGHTGLACQAPGFHDSHHPGERWCWVAETTRIEGLGERIDAARA
jgi:hypothetical protein